MSHGYVHGHHRSVLAAHRRRTATNSAGYLLPYLRPGLTVLDVGSGAGTITADLAEMVAPGRLVAVERTDPALALTRDEVRERGLETVDGIVADAARLPFPDGSFDVVHAHQVAQHLQDPVAALAEWRRVCAPDGLLAVRDADYAAFTWSPESPALDRWRSLYLAVAREAGGEPEAGAHLPSWAEAAGLRDIRTSTSQWRYGDAEERAAWGLTWAERLVASTFAERALAAGLSTTGELAGLAQGWRDWVQTEGAWFVIAHTEILASP